jgi:hypothetical protein
MVVRNGSGSVVIKHGKIRDSMSKSIKSKLRNVLPPRIGISDGGLQGKRYRIDEKTICTSLRRNRLRRGKSFTSNEQSIKTSGVCIEQDPMIDWLGLALPITKDEARSLSESSMIHHALRKLAGQFYDLKDCQEQSTISAANAAVSSLLRNSDFETADLVLTWIESKITDKLSQSPCQGGWTRLDMVTKNNRACLFYFQVS